MIQLTSETGCTAQSSAGASTSLGYVWAGWRMTFQQHGEVLYASTRPDSDGGERLQVALRCTGSVFGS